MLAGFPEGGMAHRGWQGISIGVVAVFVLSGCGDNAPPQPTAAQAGDVLKSHIDQTLKNALAVDIKTTDPGGKDIPCGSGKYKRTYAAEARAKVGSGDPEIITVALVGALSHVADYDLVDSSGRLTEEEAVSAKYHTRVNLSSPAKGKMVARGETECLPLS
ncbi:hypothetical protein ACQP1V_03725 [Microtetraspora malaysiensis]|uniref:hypothetical protein n=1 Tax=Microtetraspora malaysiensis TaxID=161358 RepID=UPI003D8B8994